MGLFYTNVILYKAQQQQIAEFMNKRNRISFVSPTLRDFTVVYEKETENQDIKVLKKLTKSLSKKFKCKALASLVHDSDLYLYWLYDNARLLDSYNSLPGYFDTEGNKSKPEGGDAKKLCEAFDKQNAISEVRHIFDLVEKGNINEDWSEEYLQGEDIHEALVQVFGMPSFAASIGYFTIVNTELPKELDRASLIKCPTEN